MTTGGPPDIPDDDKATSKKKKQSDFSMHQPRVQVLPLTQTVEPQDPQVSAQTQTVSPQTSTSGDEQDVPLFNVGEQRLVEDSTKKMVNQVSRSITEDHIVNRLNREIAFYDNKATETQDPAIKKQYAELKEVKVQQKQLYQEAQGLREEIKDAKTRLNTAHRNHEAEAKLLSNLEETYRKEPSQANKGLMEQSKKRLDAKGKDVDKFKGEIEGKQKKLEAMIPKRDELRKKSAELKKDLSAKDPDMKAFAEKEELNNKKHAEKKAALNKYSPEGKVQKLKANKAKNKERIKGIEQNPPKIGDYHTGEELLGAMIMWLLMLLMALLGKGVNKAIVHNAEKALNNKKPMLKDMKALADKRYDLANKIEALEKKAPLSEADQKKLEAMKEKLAKMDEGLVAYQDRLKKIGDFKKERNEVNRASAQDKLDSARQDMKFAKDYQDSLGKGANEMKEKLAQNQEAIDALKAKGPSLNDEEKVQLQKLQDDRAGMETTLKNVLKEKEGADKVVDYIQGRIDQAQKEVDKADVKIDKNLTQEAKEAKILNKDSGIDLSDSQPKPQPQLQGSTVDSPQSELPTDDAVLEVQRPTAPEPTVDPIIEVQSSTPQVTTEPQPRVEAPKPQDPPPQVVTSGADSPTTSPQVGVSSTTVPPNPQLGGSSSEPPTQKLGTTSEPPTVSLQDLVTLSQELGSLKAENEELQGIGSDLGPSTQSTFGATAPHATDKHNMKQELLEAQKAKKPGEKGGAPTKPRADTPPKTSTTSARH